MQVMSIDRRAKADDLKVLFREIHRLSASLKNLDFSVGDNSLLLAARGVLQLLREGGPQTVPALGRSRNTTRQNIQIIVDRLERLDCVAIASNPKHRRSGLVNLTRKGRDVLAISEIQEGRILEGLAASFSETETSRALEAVRQVATAVEGTRNRTWQTSQAEPERIRSRRAPQSKRLPEKDPTQSTGADPSEEGLPVSLL
jgi:DNA-binding MarR family transcriptional regulator